MRLFRNLPLLAAVLTAVFCAGLVLGALVPTASIVAQFRNDPVLLAQKDFPMSRLTNGRMGASTDCVAITSGFPVRVEDVGAAPQEGLWKRTMRAHKVGSCEELQAWLSGEPTPGENYFRYWNGYTLLTRPALALMPFHTLRSVGTVVTALLLLALLAVVWRRVHPRAAICLAIALAWVGIDAAVLTLIFSVGWMVAAIAGMWVLLARPERIWRPEPWFLIGALITYFELLNHALVTLTLPLLLALLSTGSAARRGALVPGTPSASAEHGRGIEPWRPFANVVMAAVSWGLGYFGLWVIRFLIAWATLGREATEVVSYKVGERLAADSQFGETSIGFALWRNLEKASWPHWRTNLFILLTLLLVGQIVWRWRALSGLRHWRQWPGSAQAWRVATLVAVGLAPFAWYAVFVNHSIVHAYFTYRFMAPTALLLMLAATRFRRTPA